MKNLTLNIKSLFIIIFLANTPFIFISSVEYNPSPPPVEKKAKSKKQKAFNKKINKLEDKINKAKSTKRKSKLKNRLSHLKNKQENANPVYSVIGLVSSIISIIVLISALIILFISYASLFSLSTVFLAAAGLIISLLLINISFFISIIGLGFAIPALILANNNPEKFGKKGMAIAALIIALIVFLICILMMIL
jgi:hypothetical protein